MSNKQYAVRESQFPAQSVRAKSLRGAMRAADRRQSFQGTSVYVYEVLSSGELLLVAQRCADALNMSARGAWEIVRD